MTDDELEQHLHAHYRAIDPRVASPGTGIRIGDALDRRPRRSTLSARIRPAFAAMAAVLIVAVGLGLGLRPGGFLSSPGVSPTAGASPTRSAPPSSASASPTPTPSMPVPSGSVPPISDSTWTGLRLQALEGGPVNAQSVVAWSGGYLALGLASVQGELPAWISRDGRSWVELPAGTFGPATLALAAPCADGILVAVQSYSGQASVWHSTDGVTWTSRPSPPMRLARQTDLAGSATGVLAVLEGSPHPIGFSTDGVTWQEVSLPGSTTSSVGGVASFGTGFVAVGGVTPAGLPVAWWSGDGLHWTLADVQGYPGTGFVDVRAAGGGLVALSSTAQVPGQALFWTSTSGRSWAPSTANPLGILKQGPANASVNGLFSGDGTRLMVYGTLTPDIHTGYWVSLNGTDWTKLALTGATAAAISGQATPFLLRDGVLFGYLGATWLGTAVK
ncbi:MAG TPA: hypothetical protein VF323_03170 [Candidatus Limnocylindrales bacterium]